MSSLAVIVAVTTAGLSALGAALVVATVAPRHSVRWRTRNGCVPDRVVARARLGAWATRATAGADGRALVAALENVARLVRTGTSLRDAVVAAVGATRPPDSPSPTRLTARAHPMRVVGDDLGRGLSVVDAARRWHERSLDRGSQLAACALVLAAGGGQQARAVDAAADLVRDRLALAAEIRAHAAQARLSAGVLVTAPIAFTAWTVASEHSVRSFIFGSPLGVVVLLVGIVLDVVGATWMAALCRSVTS